MPAWPRSPELGAAPAAVPTSQPTSDRHRHVVHRGRRRTTSTSHRARDPSTSPDRDRSSSTPALKRQTLGRASAGRLVRQRLHPEQITQRRALIVPAPDESSAARDCCDPRPQPLRASRRCCCASRRRAVAAAVRVARVRVRSSFWVRLCAWRSSRRTRSSSSVRRSIAVCMSEM